MPAASRRDLEAHDHGYRPSVGEVDVAFRIDGHVARADHRHPAPRGGTAPGAETVPGRARGGRAPPTDRRALRGRAAARRGRLTVPRHPPEETPVRVDAPDVRREPPADVHHAAGVA